MIQSRKMFNGVYYYFSQNGPKYLCDITAKNLRAAGYKARVIQEFPGSTTDIWSIYTKPSTGSPPPKRKSKGK